MPNAYPALQGELLNSPLPSSPSIFLLRSIPVGEIIVGATAATPDADTTFSTGSEQKSCHNLLRNGYLFTELFSTGLGQITAGLIRSFPVDLAKQAFRRLLPLAFILFFSNQKKS